MKKKWTIKELEILSLNFENKNKLWLLSNLPQRTWDAIKLKASLLGLNFYKNKKHEHVKSNLEILLNNCHESYYWMGFLAADGYFHKNRLKLTLSIKDFSHLQKIHSYLKIQSPIYKSANICSFSAQDKILVPKICYKFSLKPKKTYNPPNQKIFDSMKDDLFLSFIIGFIDGDGCIQQKLKSKSFSITVKLHKSWSDILEYFNNRILSISGRACRNKILFYENYVQIIWSDSQVCKFLKLHCEKVGLPVLSRKWSVINLNFCGRMELSRKSLDSVKRLSGKILTASEIADKLQLKLSTVYGILRRIRNEQRENGRL